MIKICKMFNAGIIKYRSLHPVTSTFSFSVSTKDGNCLFAFRGARVYVPLVVSRAYIVMGVLTSTAGNTNNMQQPSSSTHHGHCVHTRNHRPVVAEQVQGVERGGVWRVFVKHD